MMEAVQTSEVLVNSYQCTWRYNPEDSHLHTHHHENLKTYLMFVIKMCKCGDGCRRWTGILISVNIEGRRKIKLLLNSAFSAIAGNYQQFLCG
jgi:hypothetical protein